MTGPDGIRFEQPSEHLGQYMPDSPYIVGLGGTMRPNSSSESALRIALDHAKQQGATTRLFAGPELAALPPYDPADPARTELAREFVSALRFADGVIVASPGYHGSISGVLKNAIDYMEDMSRDADPYLSGRAVGLIATAYGWQAAVTTLGAMRSIIHALRGWPTPLGVAINTSTIAIAAEGATDPGTTARLQMVADEVVGFTSRQRLFVSQRGHAALFAPSGSVQTARF